MRRRIIGLFLILTLVLANFPAYAAGASVTSTFNGLKEVPVDATIPLQISDTVTADDITVTANSQEVSGYSLRGDAQAGYILSFEKPMKQNTNYVVTCGTSSISYTTGNNTGVVSMRPSDSNTTEKEKELTISTSELTMFLSWDSENKDTLFSASRTLSISDKANASERTLNVHFGKATNGKIQITWSYNKDLNKGTNIGPDNIISNFDITDVTGFVVGIDDYIIYIYAQKGAGNYTYVAQKNLANYRSAYIKNTAQWKGNRVTVSTVYYKVDIGDGTYTEPVETTDITSAFNGLRTVPVEAAIPIKLSESRVISADQVSVMSQGQKILSKTLTGSGTDYYVNFPKEENTSYTISLGGGKEVSFSTAYETGSYVISSLNQSLTLPISVSDLTLKITSAGALSGKNIILADSDSNAKLTFTLNNDGTSASQWSFTDTGVSIGPKDLVSSFNETDTLYLTILDYVVYPYIISNSGICTALTPYDIGAEGTGLASNYIRNSKIDFDNIYTDSTNIRAEAGIGPIEEKVPNVVTLDDFVADSSDNMILYPHFGTPVFVEPGDSFTAEITSNNTGLSTSGWLVYVENEYKSWKCDVTASEYTQDSVYLGTKAGYKLNITLPNNISPELMNLTIKHKLDSDLCYMSPQSVSIVPKLNQDFYAVAISDTHINSWKKENTTVQEGRNLETMNKALELGGARYLYHGGDIGAYVSYDKLTAVKDVFIDAFTTSKVPAIIVAGNHEFDTYSYPMGTAIRDSSLTKIDWSEVTEETDLSDKQVVSNFTFDAFDRAYGMRSALIPMGDSMLIAKHDYGAYKSLTGVGTEENLSEPFILRNALADAWQDWNGGNTNAFRIIYQHTWNTGSESTDLTNNTASPTYGAAAFMSPTYHKEAEDLIPYDFQAGGHFHSLYAMNERLLCFGGTGRDNCDWSGESILMNFDYDSSLNKRWSLDTKDTMAQDPYLGDQYIASDMTDEEIAERNDYINNEYQTDFIGEGSLEQPALSSSYYNTNDGSSDFNIATVTNKLDFNFYDGRVKFIMKKGSYRVENGELLSQYDTYDGSYTVVLAKVNIPAAVDGTPSEISVLCVPVNSSGEATYNLESAETGFVSADRKYLNIVSTADISSAQLTKENVVVKKNGTLAEYELSFPGSRICRIDFTGGLDPQSKYTVTVGSQEFVFVVLPDEYIENEYYAKGSITASSRPLSFADISYENFVMDVTIRNTTPGNKERTPNSQYSYGNLTVELHPTVDDTKYNYRFLAYRAYNPTQFRQWHMLASSTPSGNSIGDGLIASRGLADVTSILTTSPLNSLEDEESYDFRLIKVGKTLSLYCKNTQDRSYDRLFEYYDTGAAAGKEHYYLPEEAAYALIKLSANGVTNTAAKGLRLYEIKEEAGVIETNIDISADKFNVTAEINCSYKDLSNILTGKAICASYQGDKLIDIDVKELKGGLNNITFKPLLKGDKCNLFVFDSANKVVPLVRKVELYNEQSQ